MNKTLYKLAQYDKKRLHKFRDFVCSPYFNKRQKLMRLIERLVQAYPNLKELTEYDMLFAMSPEVKPSGSYLAARLSELQRLLDKFEQQQAYEQSEDLVRSSKRRMYQGESQRNHFEKACLAQIEALEKTQTHDIDRLAELLRIQVDRYNYPGYSDQPESFHTLEAIIKLIDLNFLTYKLKFTSDIETWKISRKVNTQTALPPPSDEQYATQYRDFPLIPIYARIVRYYQADVITIEDYKVLILAFDQILENHSFPKEAYFIYVKIGALSRKVSVQEEQMAEREKLELARLGIRRKLHVHSGFISQTTFINNTILLASHGKYEEAEDFIRKYRQHLTREERMLTDLGKALVRFYQGHFQEAIQFIGSYRRKSPNYFWMASAVRMHSLVGDHLLHGNKLFTIKMAHKAFAKMIRSNPLFNKQKELFIIKGSRVAMEIAKSRADGWGEEDQAAAEELIIKHRPLPNEKSLRLLIQLRSDG